MNKKNKKIAIISSSPLMMMLAIIFIENGDKAKITLRFRGREMAHQQIGRELLKRVESDLESMASVEQFPTLEGRQLVMMMAPNKKN